MTDKNELSTFDENALSALSFEMPGLLNKPFAKDIFLLKTNVMGINHIDGVIEKLRKLEVGQKLTLLLEPDNPYDKRAILVMNGDTKLGYVPRRLNGLLSRLMNAGKFLYATADDFVTSEEDEDYYWDALIISIFMQD